MRTLIPGTLQITAKVPLVMSQGKSPLKARIICQDVGSSETKRD